MYSGPCSIDNWVEGRGTRPDYPTKEIFLKDWEEENVTSVKLPHMEGFGLPNLVFILVSRLSSQLAPRKMTFGLCVASHTISQSF